MAPTALTVAGYVTLAASIGHLQVGASELGPSIRKSPLAAQHALKGWYQGCFMYAVFGLNYLRLARTALPTQLDQAILGLQACKHLYTLLGLQMVPPKILSATLLGLVGASRLGY